MEDYYHIHSRSYYQATFGIDPTDILTPLARVLRPSATVLDVGCGSGRDLCWLKSRGFKPTGLERAQGLAMLARESSGCSVIQDDFRFHDFSVYSFDGLLLLGALVHVEPLQLQPMLGRISKALAATGSMLLTLKAGKGRVTFPDGRIFTLWEPQTVERIVGELGFAVIETRESVSPIRSTDRWLNYILHRKEVQ